MSARWLWPSMILLAACSTEEDSGTDRRYAGPILTHEAPASPLVGQAVTLSVTATDRDGVALVGLYYRIEGTGVWAAPEMSFDGDVWSGTVPAEAVAAPAVEYYFKAADLGDPSAVSYLPEASTAAPFSLPVSVIGNAFPFYEDFEPVDAEQASLDDLDWGSANLAFRGYEWELSAVRAHSGSSSAFHSRTVADINPPPEDWLVSPPINLASAPTAQVVWHETGVSPEDGQHRLLISTGGNQPDSGDWVVVSDLLPTAPEDVWGRSAAYDLSAWVGGVVYLAWAYQGADLDDWSIDDVAVTELQPDFSEVFAVSPSPISSGDSGTLTVTVTNIAPVEAADVLVSVSFPDGGASVETETQTLGSVAAGATASTDFALVIDGSTPQNSYVPVVVTVASGSASLVDEGQILVGEVSTASVDWLALDDGALRLVVGVGDPDLPDWSTDLVSTTVLAGTSTFTVDITDAWAFLPAGPGDQRWWVEAESAAGGAILDFSLSFDGETVLSSMTPLAVDIGGSNVCYLPEPPSPQLTRTTTTPSELDPGTAGATATLTLVNGGAATAGPLVATLVSSHADLTVVAGGPFVIDEDVFEADESVLLSGLFEFDVAAGHVDSAPVTADLLLTDGVESWTLPVSFAVPFPVLRLTGITIDDDGGNGVLDANEFAELEFRVTNVGDEAAVGLVRGVLSVEATSSAVAVTSTDSENVGSLSASATQLVDDFTVEVTGGLPGDTVDFLMTLTDSARTYEARQQIVLGEAPWVPMNDLGDDVGDVLDGYDFDATAGWYRVVGDVLQMRIVSNTVFDGSRVFLEAWASSPVADFGLYRILAQSGTGTLQGYDFSSGTFYDLDDPVVTYPDAYTVQLDLPIPYLQLTFDEISLGWGIGWCGEPDYYCDHYPDGWGYPYTGYDSSNWYSLEW